MKTKRQNHHKGWKQALSVLLVFALAAGLVLSVPALSGVAYAAPILWDGDEGGEDNQTPAERGAAAGSNRQQITTGGDGADKLNWENLCSVTVSFPETMTGGTSDELAALKEKGVVADLYLFAPAVPLSGYDVYAYCVDSSMPYYGAVKAYLAQYPNWRTEKPMTTVPVGYIGNGNANEYLVFRYAPENPATADIREQEGLAELMAKELLLGGSTEPASTGAIDAPQKDLPAGLYLNVVHGKYSGAEEGYLDPTDAVVLVKQTDSKDDAKVCTIAYSDTKVFTFQPQLLSLPTRNEINTAEAGAWYYDLTVAAKGSGEDRYADLQIQKELAGTAAGGSTVFVFHVEATDPKGDKVDLGIDEYITLRADGTENGLVSKPITNKIPVGSTVKITEEYSGVGYQFKSAEVTVRWSDETATGTALGLETAPKVNAQEHSITIENIPAGSIHLTAPAAAPGGEEKILPDGTTETAVFTNVPDNTNNGGGTVVNSFTQDANGGWSWTKRTYDPKTGKWASETPVAGN